MSDAATEDATINHYGTTIVGPVASTPNLASPVFFTIESKQILSSEDTVDTPSHAYDPGPPILYHTHNNQVVDDRAQSYFTIEGNPILLDGDKHTAEDTRIDVAGQSFFTIS